MAYREPWKPTEPLDPEPLPSLPTPWWGGMRTPAPRSKHFDTMALAALGGCWWPIEITPPFMQQLAGWLPTGWAMNAMHQLISFQNGAAAALAELLWICLAGLALLWLAAKRFRYE